MAGFLDVSALLGRKAGKPDLKSAKDSEEGVQKPVGITSSEGEPVAETPVDSKSLLVTEQQEVSGKRQPRSPKSTLQSGSGGTTPTTPILQTLLGLVTSNGVTKETDGLGQITTPEVYEDAREQTHPEVGGVTETGLPESNADVAAQRPEARVAGFDADDDGAKLTIPGVSENVEGRADGAVSERLEQGFLNREMHISAPMAVIPIHSAGEHGLDGTLTSAVAQGTTDPHTEAKHAIPVQAMGESQQVKGESQQAMGEPQRAMGESQREANGVKDADSHSEAPAVDTARQGSGRFLKVGGLLKKTLSFPRKNASGIDQGGKGELTAEDTSAEGAKTDLRDGDLRGDEFRGGDFRGGDFKCEDFRGGDFRSGELEEIQLREKSASLSSQGLQESSSIEAPAPQVARADSGRFRSLLKKLTPGGTEARETAPPAAENGASTGGPVLETLIPTRSGESSAVAAPLPDGVNAEAPVIQADRIDTGNEPGAPGIAQQGGGRPGGLLQKFGVKRSEAQESAGGGSLPNGNGTTVLDERVSAFRIPNYLLPGGSGEGGLGLEGLEVEGPETPPACPLIVFVNSQRGEGELRRELTAILGPGQVFDTGLLPPADFLRALLPRLGELAHKGDINALAVKENLRILVVGEDALFKTVSSALQESNVGKSIPVGCVPAGGRSDLAQALGLSQGAAVSRQSVMDLLLQVADSGTQMMDCWEVKLTNHRKRTASNLPASLKQIPVDGGKGDWVLAHRGLCWGSLHLDMGYVHTLKAGGDSRAAPRKSGGWLCGMCGVQEPLVIRSQNVGRLEVLYNGTWSYLELSPQIQSLEFLNLAQAKRKMKTLEKTPANAFSDDGLIEIVGVQQGSDVEVCLAQTNAVRLELFGNAEIDHVKLRLDAESWEQPLAGETTTDPAVIQITHAGQAPVLVTPTASLKCAAPPVFRAPAFAPPPEPSPREKAPGLFRRSASPFRKGGRFRSASPFRRNARSRRSPSPGPRAPREPSEEPQTAPGSVLPGPETADQTAPERAETSAEGIPSAEATTRVLLKPRSASTEREYRGRRRAQSPVPGARTDREVRTSGEPNRPLSAPRNKTPKDYAEAATAAVKGTGVASRRTGISLPWTLKVEKMVETDRVQPQQRLARTPSGSGRQEIVEPVAKTLVRTGSGRLTGDDHGRAPSPSLYRSSSRDNLDQASLSRPASPGPGLYRSSSRDNLDQSVGLSLSRPASPGLPLSRQNSGNTGYSPRVSMMQPPRSESPVHLREPTPERLPRMADWATGMSRKSAAITYHPGVHSHLLTKQEREQAVAIGFGSTLTREERERMQALAFGGASGSERGITPQRIRSARARYVGAAAAMYNRGPLELDLATPDDKTESPPPPVRTARDYFSGPLNENGLPALRKSHGS